MENGNNKVSLYPISDIHLEGYKYGCPSLGVDKSSILIVAGDHGNKMRGIQHLVSISNDFLAIIYVPGNHEYYGTSIQQFNSKIREYVKESGVTNLYVLIEETVELEGYRFVGTTLWTDFCGKSHDSLISAELNMNDYAHIRNGPADKPWLREITPYEVLSLHEKSKSFLTKELTAKSNLRTVVITHHVPSFGLLRKDLRRLKSSCYFASNMDNFIFNELTFFDLWISGHTHYCFDVEVERKRFISNTMGYKNSRVEKFSMNKRVY